LAGVVGLVLGGAWLAVAAALYAGFFVFTLTAVRRQLPIQSCGCFGRDDTPPTWLHVTFNVIASLGLAYLAVLARPAVPWDDPALELTLYLSLSLVGAYLAYLVLSQLPRTLHMTHNG
jgi:hypothetical protein